jgi:hypothetical protein
VFFDKEAYLAGVVLNRLTSRTVSRVEGLRMILDHTRRRLDASCDQEYAEQFRSLACPVRCQGLGIEGTLNVSTASRGTYIPMSLANGEGAPFAGSELCHACVTEQSGFMETRIGRNSELYRWQL